MDFFEDFTNVNKKVIKRTSDSLKKNWAIVFTGLIYVTLNIVVLYLLNLFFSGPLSILAGIAGTLASSALMSNYLYLLFNIINYSKFTIQDFKDGFGYFLRKIYGVFFIAYVASLLLSVLQPMLGNLTLVLNIIIYLTILLILNPLPETIYLKSLSSGESIIYTLEFIQENWLYWLLPNAVFYVLIYYTSGNLLLNIFNTHLSFFNILDPKDTILYFIGQLIFSFMMIYRGHLYKILSTSTRRKRMFMNKF